MSVSVALSSSPPITPPSALLRVAEVVTVGLGLAVLWPVLAVVAVAIRWESPGPVLFRQVRVGQGGRHFTIYKFRSMRRDAPPTAYAQITDLDRFVFTPPGSDARRTRIGAVLRRTSLDEAPQLLNVLRGEMALVGPRPEIPEIVARYRPEDHARHRVRPGLTGLAQINGRADLTYAETLAYDRTYVETRSPGRDLLILVRTLLPVLRGIGAR